MTDGEIFRLRWKISLVVKQAKHVLQTQEIMGSLSWDTLTKKYVFRLDHL